MHRLSGARGPASYSLLSYEVTAFEQSRARRRTSSCGGRDSHSSALHPLTRCQQAGHNRAATCHDPGLDGTILGAWSTPISSQHPRTDDGCVAQSDHFMRIITPRKVASCSDSRAFPLDPHTSMVRGRSSGPCAARGLLRWAQCRGALGIPMVDSFACVSHGWKVMLHSPVPPVWAVQHHLPSM